MTVSRTPLQPFAIAVDLGGTNLRIAAVQEDGTIVEKITLGTHITAGREHVISEMCSSIDQLRRKHRDRELKGIGIGVPGIIDMETGLLHESPNLPGWDNYPVQTAIEQRLGTMVILENDANSAAFGEYWMGAGRGRGDLCMLTLGTGVGGGLILNGRIWRGARGMAAEMGHVTVEPDGVSCPCGNIGCLEQYASATAIRRMAREEADREPSDAMRKALTGPAEFEAAQVYALAMEGDPAAKRVFERVGRALGISLAALINVLNLPMYVIGGGVSAGWEAFAPAMIAEIRKRSFVYEATSPEAGGELKKTIVARALLGGDAGLIGAARLPWVAKP